MASQPLEAEGTQIRRRTSQIGGVGLNGTSITNSFIGRGLATDDEDLKNSDGGRLTIMSAFMVSFCIAFGAGIALVGWYPKLAGMWGYAFVIVLVSFSGGIAENALHVVTIKTKANSFTQLCEILPRWMSRFTSVSMIVWGFTIAGLYIRYMFNFINLQLIPEGSRFDEQGMGSLGLYVPIGVVVYFACLPPKFSGRVVAGLTNVNLVITWVVIIVAMMKGISMVTTTPAEQRPPEFEQWKPSGFLQVTVLLAGAMFQCQAVPQLQYELAPDLRERAAVVIPLALAVVQGGIFLIIGLIGYWALGECINDDGDVFKSYFEIRPDWMVTVLQGGIATLMFLSTPLLGVPPKNELHQLLQVCAGKSDDEKTDLEGSSAFNQAMLNLVMVAYAALITPVLGQVALMNFVTIQAGTFANWMNMFLPVFVTLYNDVFPARAKGEPYAASALKCAWIFVIATASLYSSLVDIWLMIEPVFGGGPEVPVANETISPFCEALR